LKAGLLTFGGAYTLIPFLQQDAVAVSRLNDQSPVPRRSRALSGILPAPLIIFSTFVGFFGAGPLGALAMTVAIFLPAFAFTFVGHHVLERLIGNVSVQAYLDGVAAGVVESPQALVNAGWCAPKARSNAPHPVRRFDDRQNIPPQTDSAG